MNIFSFVERLFQRNVTTNEFPKSGPEPTEWYDPDFNSFEHHSKLSRSFDEGLAEALSVARAQGRPVLAGTIELVGLKSITRDAGSQWQEFPDEARKIAEDEIARSLGPQDLFRAYDRDNFALCFVNLNEAQAKAKAKQIAEAIRARILLTRPDESRPFSVKRFVSPVSLENFDGIDGTFG